MTTLIQKQNDVIKVGTVVGILNSDYEYATVVEDRGGLGPRGERIYAVRLRLNPEPVCVEVMESQIVVSHDYETLVHAIKTWPKGQPFTLSEVMGDKRWSKVKAPTTFGKFVKEKVVAGELADVQRYDLRSDNHNRYVKV